MNKRFFTVFKFELSNLLRNRTYRITTLVLALLMVLALSLPGIISLFRRGDGQAQDTPDLTGQGLYVVDESGLFSEVSREALQSIFPDKDWRLGETAELETYRQQLDKQEIFGVLTLKPQFQYQLETERLTMTQSFTDKLTPVLDQLQKSALLMQAGLPGEQVSGIMTPGSLQVIERAAQAGKTAEQAYISTYAVAMLLYTALMFYGQMVASSVASEKSNRAMEMLITSTNPLNLIFGKVAGTAVAGFAQMSVLFLVYRLAYHFNQAHLSSIQFINQALNLPLPFVALALLSFLLGFFTFAFIYAALGSLVSRIEDLGQVIGHVSLILVGVFMMTIFATITPEAGWVTVLSMVPLAAPQLMFVRVSMLSVPLWQLIVSYTVQVFTILGMGWLATTIYRLGVLLYGNPPKPKELVRLLRRANS